MPKTIEWRCENCSETYSTNPEECDNCGHTVLQQHRPKSTKTDVKSQAKSVSNDISESHWVCKKCEHKHDRKPFVCDECNSSTLYKEEPMRIIEADEGNSSDSSSAIWFWSLWMLFLLVFLLLALGILLQM